jgi:hypothetical protein
MKQHSININTRNEDADQQQDTRTLAHRNISGTIVAALPGMQTTKASN